MSTARVLNDIDLEREHQLDKWTGVYDDDDYTPEQWLNLMGHYADRARKSVGIVEERRRFIQIAALAVAAVEALDRKTS